MITETSATDDLHVVSPHEAGALLGIHPNTLKRLRRAGTGPAVTLLSPSRVGYRVKDIREWLAKQQEAPMLNDHPAPSPRERTELMGECVEVIRALRGHDYGLMNEILRASKYPAWKHAIEFAVMCTYLVNRSDDPERTLVDLLIAGDR